MRRVAAIAAIIGLVAGIELGIVAGPSLFRTESVIEYGRTGDVNQKVNAMLADGWEVQHINVISSGNGVIYVLRRRVWP